MEAVAAVKDPWPGKRLAVSQHLTAKDFPPAHFKKKRDPTRGRPCCTILAPVFRQASSLSRDPASDDPINVALNYGYGVIQAAVHREAIIHGLNPLFGVRHVARAGNHAFVYDLMEPLRHWAEYAVAHNYQKDGVLEMRDFRVKFLEFMETKLGPKGNSRTRFDWVRQHILAVCKGIKSGTPLRELPSA